jgi:hypothetical protein
MRAAVSQKAIGQSERGRTLDAQAVVLSEAQPGDPQFLHSVLCQLGLPRNPTGERNFERTSGRVSLSLQAGRSFDGMKWSDQPLPSGTRPRLVLINLCSEAVRRRSADVDIGNSVRDFLRRLNIDTGGESMAQFRRQMLALSVCHMTLAVITPKGPAQVDAKPIDAFQAWYTDEDGQQALWPGHLRLTDKFFNSLVEHAVPLDQEAIGRLQNSALALDVYSWLAHRLCRVREPTGIDLSWGVLKEQFGQEYGDAKNFKRKFLGAIGKAKGVYADARIEQVSGGLRLLPSPPPVKRVAVTVTLPPTTATAVPLLAPSQAEKKSVTFETLVSAEALEQVPDIAPGWDKYWLEARYREFVRGKNELPRNADAAFLGWVRKFTKGKRPQ